MVLGKKIRKLKKKYSQTSQNIFNLVFSVKKNKMI